MKHACLLLLSNIILKLTFAQATTDYSITPVDDGLYYLYYDSSTAKSTVVEFDKFIALLEVPIKNEGGGATNLKDHVYGGDKVIELLKKHFPDKPLRYLLHTHWHPHSISSVKPFLVNGATIVTTRPNFEKLKEFVDPQVIVKYQKQIQFVETDSLVIKDKKNKIVAHRFLKKDFQSTPTPEYLFFFLPKYQSLHAGCMFYRMTGQVEGREVLTDRVRDMNKFILSVSLSPDHFIRCNGDREETDGMISFATFSTLVAKGISSVEIREKYFQFDEQTFHERKDSILSVMIRNHVPVSMCNESVYSCLRKNELSKALAFAQLQVLLNPADPNSWDTLGEVYYFLGQQDVAAYYETQTLRIDKKFTAGGKKVWETDLIEFSKNWK